MKLFCLLLIAFLLLNVTRSFSQTGIGEWTDYQSYASAKDVADTGDKIYCVTEGGLFSYSKSDNSVQKITGINGLSDTGAQKVAYDKENNVLFIAYQNSNIDLLIGNTVFNLSDIKRKQLQANKTINNILFSGKMAYLACGFGIVVVNLEKKEIKDTYFIGNEGDYLNVLDLATDGQFFYAATANGLFKASVSEPNLQNYTNWVKETTIPNADKKFNNVEFFNGHIIANYTPDLWDKDEMYQLNGSIWSRFLPGVRYVRDLTSTDNYLVVTGQEGINVFDKNYNQVKEITKYPLAGHENEIIYSMSAIIDSQNTLWIAYAKQGLVKMGSQAEKIVPEGPVDNNIFSMTSSGQDLWIASGGRNAAWNNIWSSPQFQLKRDGKWSVFDKTTFQNTNNFTDIVCISVDPNNPDHVFAGSWGGGILEFNNGKFVKRYDNFNSSLQTALPDTPNEPFVRIGGMAFDSNGALWASNAGVANALSSMQPDGTWKSYALSNAASKYVSKVVITKNNDKWVLLGKANGLSALNSANSITKAQRVVAYFSNGTNEIYTDMNDVYTMALDHDGTLWVGTSAGVAVYSNPEKVWKDAFMYASRPGIKKKDNLFHPLLETETITAIAIDGGNRKWFGTKSSGVYLISADGETEIEHFNTENSPLLNNEITDIAINQKTGEVFIGTINGLISYMGDATEANDAFSEVYVYPNPVRENYDGPVVVKDRKSTRLNSSHT